MHPVFLMPRTAWAFCKGVVTATGSIGEDSCAVDWCNTVTETDYITTERMYWMCNRKAASVQCMLTLKTCPGSCNHGTDDVR